MQKSDGTIDQYGNSILTNFTKTDLNSDTVKVTNYKDKIGKNEKTVENLKVSDIMKREPTKPLTTSSLQNSISNSMNASIGSFPYSDGFSFNSSYTDYNVTGVTVGTIPSVLVAYVSAGAVTLRL